jgi:chromosome segregation and condensation protein ScpB
MEKRAEAAESRRMNWSRNLERKAEAGESRRTGLKCRAETWRRKLKQLRAEHVDQNWKILCRNIDQEEEE